MTYGSSKLGLVSEIFFILSKERSSRLSCEMNFQTVLQGKSQVHSIMGK